MKWVFKHENLPIRGIRLNKIMSNLHPIEIVSQ